MTTGPNDLPPELAEQLEALRTATAPTEVESIELSTMIDREDGETALERIEIRPLTWGDIGKLKLTLDGLRVDDLLALAVLASELTARESDDLDLVDLHRIIERLSGNLAPLLRTMRLEPSELPAAGRDPRVVPVTTPDMPAGLESLTLAPLVAGHVRGIGLDLEQLTWGELRQIAGRATGQPDAFMRRLQLDDVSELARQLLPFLLRLQGI